jgi:SAM-dependent methyltransferase
MRPSYELAIKRAGLRAGQTVLDAGCGSGAFLRVAADHGAIVSGIDASEALLAIARERVPNADLSLGDLQRLPYPDDTFDAVTGFCSFFFADDMVEALREAGRVAKPGAPVVIQVWGRPERFDLGLMKAVLARFRPPPPADRLDPSTLWRPGVLEDLAVQAGLIPDAAFDDRFAYEYADEESMSRAMLSAGGFGAIVGDRQDEARAAVLEALAVCRTPACGYRIENDWHFLIARAA